MSLFVLSKVYKDQNKTHLKLINIYDDVDLCHLYVNYKRTTSHITLFHKRMIEEKEDIIDQIDYHNHHCNQKCDYVIEEIILNQNY